MTESNQSFDAFVHMPHGNATDVAWPVGKKRVVVRLIAFDHVGYQRPIESWMPVPLITPGDVAWHV